MLLKKAAGISETSAAASGPRWSSARMKGAASSTRGGASAVASGGELLAVAKYPKTLAGAADALKSCDYTDLDEDGNSDLTAEFSFADGRTASLVWFFADGGLIYNEEFSCLPGEADTAETN